MYSYHAYGLNLSSAIPIPELGDETEGKPDITIAYGEVPTELPHPSANGIAWQAAPGKTLLTVADIARYLILGDSEVLIEPIPGSSEREVRLFLLGSVLGAILHARQILVLHSSVIQTEDGAVLFMGKSGAGKSTLLGAFLMRGYSMLSDDKAGIVLSDEGVAEVMPGFPTIRITEETVEKLGYPLNGAKASPGLGKYVVPVTNFCSDQIPVRAAYRISVHNRQEIVIDTLDPVDRFHVLNENTYRRRFLHESERRKSHFKTLSALSKQISVKRITRPLDKNSAAELVDQIEEDLRP